FGGTLDRNTSIPGRTGGGAGRDVWARAVAQVEIRTMQQMTDFIAEEYAEARRNAEMAIAFTRRLDLCGTRLASLTIRVRLDRRICEGGFRANSAVRSARVVYGCSNAGHRSGR